MEHDAAERTDAERQAIHDNYLIDHLVHAFQPEPDQPSNGARTTIAAPVYDHIRDSWAGPTFPR
ncbi:MAG TPA: hypothetical protein VMU87_16565 [Stellaceae bacterium]|nr:hypothetical protein [Stellaceae bacterium]